MLLLTGAALGDRFGRRLMFVDRPRRSSPLASAAAALAPTSTRSIAARAVQGVGGAIVTPLTLTLLSRGGAAGEARRSRSAPGAGSAASRSRSARSSAAPSSTGLNWHWIFWLNVPIGLILAPLALRAARESHGPSDRLDLPGLGLVSVGLFGIVWGLVRGNGQGWSSPEIVG